MPLLRSGQRLACHAHIEGRTLLQRRSADVREMSLLSFADISALMMNGIAMRRGLAARNRDPEKERSIERWQGCRAAERSSTIAS